MTTPASKRYEWFADHIRAGTVDESVVVEGFASSFLANVPADRVVAISSQLARSVSQPESNRTEHELSITVVYEDTVASARVEAAPPHRFEGLTFRSKPTAINDYRLGGASWRIEGDAGDTADLLRADYVEHGLIGVVAAGFDANGADLRWSIAGGFADLDTVEAVGIDQQMLAGSITKLLTAVATLRLIDDGVIDLDQPANRYLVSMRVSDDATVRHLLTHTAGVASAFEHYHEHVRPAAEVLGETVAHDFAPGRGWAYSNGGYTVLGEVIAGAVGRTYADVLDELVVGPLGMVDSSLATHWPSTVGPGYDVADGKPVVVMRRVPSVLAGGGLCTTVADLARFVAGWRSLLSAELAAAATSRQTLRPDGADQGFGWRVGTMGGRPIAGHGGGVLGFSSSLLWRPDTGVCTILMTNRSVAAEQINVRLLAASDDSTVGPSRD